MARWSIYCGRLLAVAGLLAQVSTTRAAELSIAKADAYDTSDHQRVADLSVAAAPGVKVDVSELSVVTLFYARARDGSVAEAYPASKVRWLTAPADWAGGKTEGLEIQWPAADRSAGNAPLGVVVGLYYRKALQVTWAFPSSLAKDFPLPAREKLAE
ncbi:hypothetical protein BH09VER1_BH09VER1_43480 [soil metagenome]